VWGKGFCTIGAVTFESAAYTARYIAKKINGAMARKHYELIDEHGEVFDREPEYTTMSLKSPIGEEWLNKFKGDVYPDDFVVVRGKRMKPPKFYDRIYEEENPVEHAELVRVREKYARAHKLNGTPERLAVRKKVLESRISTLKRELE